MNTPARAAIEAAAQLCERRALTWGCADSGRAVAASFRGTANEIRALPAEPDEPTEAMIEAGQKAYEDYRFGNLSWDTVAAIYLAMRAAATRGGA